MSGQLSARRAIRPRRGRLHRARGVVLALRAITVVALLFSLSGCAEALIWLDGHDTRATAGCCSDCPASRDGRECPPSCPLCHCAHGGVVLPPALATHAIATALGSTLALPPGEATEPAAPLLHGIYRPPRAI